MNSKPTFLSPEALDFSPGLLSIQESPPARLPRAVMYTVGVLFVILMVWAIFGKLDIIASAEGRLVPAPKGVSLALHLEKPCHVAHALN